MRIQIQLFVIVFKKVYFVYRINQIVGIILCNIQIIYTKLDLKIAIMIKLMNDDHIFLKHNVKVSFCLYIVSTLVKNLNLQFILFLLNQKKCKNELKENFIYFLEFNQFVTIFHQSLKTI